MSSKIGNIVLAIVFIQILLLISISITETSKSMKSTYKSYAKNLAQEVAVGVDFAVESGENTYGNSAMNLNDIIERFEI